MFPYQKIISDKRLSLKAHKIMLSYKKVQCAVANAIQRITGFLLSFPYTPTLICVLDRYWNLTQFWKVSIVADWLANARWLTDIHVNITVIQNLCMFILLLVFNFRLRARHNDVPWKQSVFALMSDYSYYTLYFDIKANKIAKN